MFSVLRIFHGRTADKHQEIMIRGTRIGHYNLCQHFCFSQIWILLRLPKVFTVTFMHLELPDAFRCKVRSKHTNAMFENLCYLVNHPIRSKKNSSRGQVRMFDNIWVFLKIIFANLFHHIVHWRDNHHFDLPWVNIHWQFLISVKFLIGIYDVKDARRHFA